MLNFIWITMIFLSILVGAIQGRLDSVATAVTESAKFGFNLSLSLVGIMCLWMGMMNIAKEAGLVNKLAKMLLPITKKLFPDVPSHDPAMGAIVMNIAANMLGLANAATPFGLQAMKELQRLNNHVNTASNAMCTFLAINTSSVQLIPVTAIAILAAHGNAHPSSIMLSSLLATLFSTMVAIIAVKQLAKLPIYQIKESITYDGSY